jgi:hypothetical protein
MWSWPEAPFNIKLTCSALFRLGSLSFDVGLQSPNIIEFFFRESHQRSQVIIALEARFASSNADLTAREALDNKINQYYLNFEFKAQ